MLPGNCLTTAMGILPHTDLARAMDLAFQVDIPFWPQLPRLSFYEDMYVQVSEKFPGIILDEGERRITLDMEGFYQGLEEYVLNFHDPSYFRLSPAYSQAFDAFLARDLTAYPAVRGQSIGPVSFGLKITDTTQTPIIYHDEVRGFLFEFIAHKVAAQYHELAQKNPSAFVWVDEPGLEMVFTAVTGYPAERALADYREFLARLPGPKGVHLCGNPDWSFLLGLELDILSADVLAWGHIFTRYVVELKAFLDRGGIISWGITPTMTHELEGESAATMVNRLEGMWDYLAGRGVDKKLLLSRAWLAPARCCLLNLDGGATVEKSLALLQEVSSILRDRYGMY